MSEWENSRRVGTTLYRRADPSEIIGARVANADMDAVYLNKSGLHFVVFTDQMGHSPVEEYASIDDVRMDYDEARHDAGLI